MTSSVETVGKTATNVKNVVKQGVKTVGAKLGTNAIPVVVKATGKTIVVSAAICAALGLDGWTCKAKVASGEIGEAEISKALSSKKTTQKLNQLSPEEARALGLY